MQVSPLRAGFVAKIDGLDLRAKLSRDQSAQLRDAAATYAVLVVHNQDIAYEDFLRFAASLGSVGRCGDITNLNDDGSIRTPTSLDARQARGNALWHTDMPVLKAPPLAAMLLAQEIPPSGGETQFADLADAWRALDSTMREQIKSKKVVHTMEAIRRRMGMTDPDELKSEYPASEHPLVCYDPFSGRQSMLFGAHTERFSGMSDADSAALLEKLLIHATRGEFVHTHSWRRHDLLMWNNRRVLHRVLPYDDATQRRRLWRAEVIGGKPPSRWPRTFRQMLAAV